MPPPSLGSKAIFLPNFTVALVRTPHLPPNFAQFVVPLNINKLDLRDYLLHGYGVDVLAVRSFITQQRVERHKPGFTSTKYYRPRSIKKMTVELVRPFVYPEEPKDLSPWDNELWKALNDQRDKSQKEMGPHSYKNPNPHQARLRGLAEEEVVVGETTTEVETDISLR